MLDIVTEQRLKDLGADMNDKQALLRYEVMCSKPRVLDGEPPKLKPATVKNKLDFVAELQCCYSMELDKLPASGCTIDNNGVVTKCCRESFAMFRVIVFYMTYQSQYLHNNLCGLLKYLLSECAKDNYTIESVLAGIDDYKNNNKSSNTICTMLLKITPQDVEAYFRSKLADYKSTKGKADAEIDMALHYIRSNCTTPGDVDTFVDSQYNLAKKDKSFTLAVGNEDNKYAIATAYYTRNSVD